MEQLIIKATHDTGVPSALIIGTQFNVKVEPDGTGLEVTVEKDESQGISFHIPVEKEDYPYVEELCYESWETGFDEKFSHSIVLDICEYLQTGRYWDDSEVEYRPCFDMEVYEDLWADRLYTDIDLYKSGNYPLTEEAELYRQMISKEEDEENKEQDK